MPSRSKGLTVAILGCGKIGQAVLQGLLAAALQAPTTTNDSATNPHPLVDSIQVTVRSDAAVERVSHATRPFLAGAGIGFPGVEICKGDRNRAIALRADIVLIGCKHTALAELLADLQGGRGDLCRSHGRDNDQMIVPGSSPRVLVSLVGGVSAETIARQMNGQDNGDQGWLVTRAVCSVAAAVRESVTVLSDTEAWTTHSAARGLVTALFEQVGIVRWLPERQMHAASALGSSSVAFFAGIIAALAEGLGAEGDDETENEDDAATLPLQVALEITAQAARGAATLIHHQRAPQEIVAQVSTKGGATEAGSAVLESKRVMEGLRECTVVTAKATAGLGATSSQGRG
ncbi:pyrroline-5-carboxylate reductase family protein [Aspergillus fijiensis CBS 313.89]|uniref:Pyrroline-5-carboxylate reductase n=1 Tax=Aspergillus fijiensis CBS 313.89 TaxID=1448319 RepID=A0A8G1RX38_9EURO|nr:uncharacterized protein BO72DRAFT_241004 [Aspergillus fijiensis CBS 313.89]RAK81170.1 hypothetical protein BO72DRAFT_241004 [Aspergillus fijiensis CBS 313.89]